MKVKLELDRVYKLATCVNAMQFIGGVCRGYEPYYDIDPDKRDSTLLNRFNKLSDDDKIRFLKSAVILNKTLRPLATADVEVEVE